MGERLKGREWRGSCRSRGRRRTGPVVEEKTFANTETLRGNNNKVLGLKKNFERIISLFFEHLRRTRSSPTTFWYYDDSNLIVLNFVHLTKSVLTNPDSPQSHITPNPTPKSNPPRLFSPPRESGRSDESSSSESVSVFSHCGARGLGASKCLVYRVPGPHGSSNCQGAPVDLWDPTTTLTGTVTLRVHPRGRTVVDRLPQVQFSEGEGPGVKRVHYLHYFSFGPI